MAVVGEGCGCMRIVSVALKKNCKCRPEDQHNYNPHHICGTIKFCIHSFSILHWSIIPSRWCNSIMKHVILRSDYAGGECDGLWWCGSMRTASAALKWLLESWEKYAKDRHSNSKILQQVRPLETYLKHWHWHWHINSHLYVDLSCIISDDVRYFTPKLINRAILWQTIVLSTDCGSK